MRARLKSAISTKIPDRILTIILVLLWFIAGNEFVSSQALRQQQLQKSQQRMCFQCHMPLQCKSGFCFGDFCVKSLVADRYVSKGCENRSNLLTVASSPSLIGVSSSQQTSQFHGPLHARSALTIGTSENGENGKEVRPLVKVPILGSLGIAPGCIKMNVFGQPNVICYCNDEDYCNRAVAGKTHSSLFFLLLPLVGAQLFLLSSTFHNW